MPSPNPKILTTLCLVHQHPRILLGMKKRGFGAGRWNGFGGKLDPGESFEEAAKREMIEEIGLMPRDLEKIGTVEFAFEEGSKTIEVQIFKCLEFEGEPVESEEMRPQWFDVTDIPFKQMWPDDLYWMPLFLKGKKFKGHFLFDRPSNADYASKIIEHSIVEIG